MPVTQVKARDRARGASTLASQPALTRAPARAQAMHAGPWGAAGTLFAIDVAEGERPSSIKAKLAAPTGIPAASQKLMLGAFSQARACCTRARRVQGWRANGMSPAHAPHSPPALRQIMVGDKRSSVKFGTCGVTEGLGLTVEVRAPRRVRRPRHAGVLSAGR